MSDSLFIMNILLQFCHYVVYHCTEVFILVKGKGVTFPIVINPWCCHSAISLAFIPPQDPCLCFHTDQNSPSNTLALLLSVLSKIVNLFFICSSHGYTIHELPCLLFNLYSLLTVLSQWEEQVPSFLCHSAFLAHSGYSLSVIWLNHYMDTDGWCGSCTFKINFEI